MTDAIGLWKEEEILEEQRREKGVFAFPTHRPVRVHIIVPKMGVGTAPELDTLLMRLMGEELDTFGAAVTVGFGQDIRPRDFMRNFLVHQQFLPTGADYLYFIDSDTVPNKNFMHLITWKKQVVGGLYLMFQSDAKVEQVNGKSMIVPDPRLEPCAFVKSEEEIAEERKVDGEPYWYKPVLQMEAGKLTPVDMMGTGCILIHRSVFERMDYPYFLNHYKKDGAEGISEDVDFAYKLNALGIEQYLDASVYCAHFKSLNLQEVHALRDRWSQKMLAIQKAGYDELIGKMERTLSYQQSELKRLGWTGPGSKVKGAKGVILTDA